MTRDFFVKLTFAVHKVADLFPTHDIWGRTKASANSLLAYLLACETDVLSGPQKHELAQRGLKELETLLACLYEAKEKKLVAPENFTVLEREYGKVRSFLENLARLSYPQLSSVKEEEMLLAMPSVVPVPARAFSVSSIESTEQLLSSEYEGELTLRQQKILDFLRIKGKAQVWELKKLLPEVTKRTLRRDLDDLMKRNLIDREGEWNAIFYTIRPVEKLLEEVGHA